MKELNGESTIGSTGRHGDRRHALLMGAQIKRRQEECALGMVQKLNAKDAVVKDVQIKSSKEEFALSMGQRGNNVAVKDV